MRSNPVLLVALLLCASTCTPAAAAAIDDVVAQLQREARDAKDARRFDVEQPDIAQRTDEPIDPADVLPLLLKRVDSDPFIDAYIRWQLTSFEPDIAALDDRQFMALLRNAPRVILNPRATLATIEPFARAEGANRISDSDMQHLRELAEKLESDTALVEMFNRPALEFREWVQAQLGDAGVRSHQCRLERCLAITDSGWPTRSIKTEMTRALRDAADDDTFTREQREDLASQLARLKGIRRQFIEQVTFMADGSVRLAMSTAQITKRDVDRWTESLLAPPDQDPPATQPK